MGRPRIYANASERAAAWKLANPERARAHNVDSTRAWRQRNPAKYADQLAAARQGYGVTVDEIAALYRSQVNACAICREPERDKRLAIDHDHVTGRVRGLLCAGCNMALGLLGDSRSTLEAAIAYLGDGA